MPGPLHFAGLDGRLLQGGGGGICAVDYADRVDSVPLVGLALVLPEEAVPEVRATVVAADLALIPQVHFAPAVLVEDKAVSVPPAIGELRLCRVELIVAALTLEVPGLREELAEFALPRNSRPRHS